MRPLPRQLLRSLPLKRPTYRAYSTGKTSAPHNAHSPAVFGAALVVVGYMGWRLTSSDKIALDAPQRPSHTSTQLSAHLEDKEGDPAPRISADTSGESDSKPPQASPSPPTSSEPVEPSEEDSEGASAFNPETGEINWDCPCLGGMAHGPCGLQFREAFSCFVFSEQEPKGIDCVEKFRLMQECFREHPDVYGEELIGDDESDEASGSQSVPDPSSSSVDSPVDISEPSQSTSESQTTPSAQ